MDRVVVDSTKRIKGIYNPPSHKGVDIGFSYYGDYIYDWERNKVFPNCYGIVAYTEDGLGNMEGASGWGNYVLIKHPNGMYSRYAHLQKGLKVKVGQEVNENTLLGYIGDSGLAYGMHLHFEVQMSASANNRIDPTPYLSKAIWENTPAPEPTPKPTPIDDLKIGDHVEIIKTGKASIYGEEPTAYGIGWHCVITKIYEGYPYPYRVDDKEGAIGFYQKDALKKI